MATWSSERGSSVLSAWKRALTRCSMDLETTLRLAAIPIVIVCVAAKVWIIYNCPGHPHYRGPEIGETSSKERNNHGDRR